MSKHRKKVQISIISKSASVFPAVSKENAFVVLS
jgi:hypothetical protein